MEGTVKVRQDVYDGIEKLRLSGRTQLTDLPRSIKELEEMGEYAASDWVQNNWELYEQGLRNGFEVAP